MLSDFGKKEEEINRKRQNNKCVAQGKETHRKEMSEEWKKFSM